MPSCEFNLLEQGALYDRLMEKIHFTLNGNGILLA